ncbi:MAG: protein phosphatase CheZ [Candidatus Zixiibacteriota bacterium]|nr:MAG: protein phosphatase CheZ [candidate division Zixibacteria bacterium]
MQATNNAQSKIQHEILELWKSVSGLVESFRLIRNPIQEFHRKVPQATDQLDKGTEQTEAVTHHMIDMVERITQRDEEIKGIIIEVKKEAETGNLDEVHNMLDKISQQVNTNLNDTYTIMDALQFQDITSQQIDHAAALLEDIESKLQNIISVFDVESPTASDVKMPVEANASPDKKQHAFDPKADYSDKKADQHDIDQLFDKSRGIHE